MPSASVPSIAVPLFLPPRPSAVAAVTAAGGGMKSRKSKLPTKRHQPAQRSSDDEARDREQKDSRDTEHQQVDEQDEAKQGGQRKRLKRLSALSTDESIERELEEERKQLREQAEQQDKELEKGESERRQRVQVRQRAANKKQRAGGVGSEAGPSSGSQLQDKSAARFASFLRMLGT